MDRIKKLQDDSNRKLALLEEMHALTLAQSEFFDEDHLEELGRLVAEKQSIIDAINKLDEDFDTTLKQLKSELKVDSLDALAGLKLPGAGQLKSTIADVLIKIRDISALEKQNNEKANELLTTFRGEIQKINRGRKANSAYMAGPATQPSYFIDKKK